MEEAYYGSTTSFHRASLATTKGSWKNLVKHQELITCIIQHCFGNGATTTFWNDPWVSRPHRSSHCKDALVKDVLGVINNFWNLQLCRNLNDIEASEWVDLNVYWGSRPYFIISTYDYWRQPLNTNNQFFSKSILANLTDPFNLLETTWGKGHIRCSTKENAPIVLHIFTHCSLTFAYQNNICFVFGWSPIFPNDVWILLNMILLGHPFKNIKAPLCLHINQLRFSFGFFGKKGIKEFYWIRRSLLTFSSISLLIMLYLGGKSSALFGPYSYSSLLSNWENLL